MGNILSAQGVNGGVLNDIANEKSWNMRDYSDWELPGFRANRGGSVCIQTDHIDSGRAVYRNFAKGGVKLGYGQKRGGAPGGSSVVSCKVLHSRGGECPPPPR